MTTPEPVIRVVREHFTRCLDPETCVDDVGPQEGWLGCSGHISKVLTASEFGQGALWQRERLLQPEILLMAAKAAHAEVANQQRDLLLNRDTEAEWDGMGEVSRELWVEMVRAGVIAALTPARDIAVAIERLKPVEHIGISVMPYSGEPDRTKTPWPE